MLAVLVLSPFLTKTTLDCSLMYVGGVPSRTRARPPLRTPHSTPAPICIAGASAVVREGGAPPSRKVMVTVSVRELGPEAWALDRAAAAVRRRRRR